MSSETCPRLPEEDRSSLSVWRDVADRTWAYRRTYLERVVDDARGGQRPDERQSLDEQACVPSSLSYHPRILTVLPETMVNLGS